MIIETNTLFQQLLKLPPQWIVREEIFAQSTEVHIRVDYAASTSVDESTGEVWPVYDKRSERCWRHLDKMGYLTHICCRVPRIKNSNGKIVSIFYFGHLKMNIIQKSLRTMPLKCLWLPIIRRRQGCSYEKINRLIHNGVKRGLALSELQKEDILYFGIDEKNYKKVHHYATVISNQEKKNNRSKQGPNLCCY